LGGGSHWEQEQDKLPQDLASLAGKPSKILLEKRAHG